MKSINIVSLNAMSVCSVLLPSCCATNLRHTYATLRENDKAIYECTNVIDLKPDIPFAYNNRGSAFYNKADYNKAIDNYNKAVTLYPEFESAYNNRYFTP